MNIDTGVNVLKLNIQIMRRRHVLEVGTWNWYNDYDDLGNGNGNLPRLAPTVIKRLGEERREDDRPQGHLSRGISDRGPKSWKERKRESEVDGKRDKGSMISIGKKVPLKWRTRSSLDKDWREVR